MAVEWWGVLWCDRCAQVWEGVGGVASSRLISRFSQI